MEGGVGVGGCHIFTLITALCLPRRRRIFRILGGGGQGLEYWGGQGLEYWGGARFRIFGGGARFRIFGGGARFRILGGQGLEYWGGGQGLEYWGGGQGLEYWEGGARFRILGGARGANSQRAHCVIMTSMRRNDVASSSFRRHVPTRFGKSVPNYYISHLKI